MKPDQNSYRLSPYPPVHRPEDPSPVRRSLDSEPANYEQGPPGHGMTLVERDGLRARTTSPAEPDRHLGAARPWRPKGRS